MRPFRSLSRALGIVLVALFFTLSSATAQTPRIGSTVKVAGSSTIWQLQFLKIRQMDRIPTATWRQYNPSLTYYVLSLKLTNTGRASVDPLTDLMLNLKIMPDRTQSGKIPSDTGYASVDKQSLGRLYNAVLHVFGGTAPWVAAHPGQSVTYTYLIMVTGHYHGYGLYNFPVKQRQYVFLLDTGI